MKRRAVHLGLVASFAFAIVLSASPTLHERFHPDAKQASHECAVTLIRAGNCHDAVVTPPLVTAAAAIAFHQTPFLVEVRVPALFLSARIFEHAPPAGA